MGHLTGTQIVFVMSLLLLVQSGPALARPLDQKNDIVGPPSFKLALTSLDFGLPNVTLLQGLQYGLHRSSLRLKHVHHVTSMQHMSEDSVSFETLVSTAPGGFMTTASIGTPPVSFTAIVDTGSDLVWRQCLPCEQCYKQKSGVIFDPSHSSTYEHAPCDDTLCSALSSSTCSPRDFSSPVDAPSFCSYTYIYEDLSFTIGDFSYDTLTLPDLAGHPQSLPNFAFGCGHNNKGVDNFVGMGGLIGFGPGATSLPSQLHVPKFSYCLQSVTDAASLTSPLFIGAAADLQSTSPSDSVFSTPLISNGPVLKFYYVDLKGITVGGKAVDIPLGTFDIKEDGSGGIIFDSGTTLTFLVGEAYDSVVAAFKASIPLSTVDGSGVGLDVCYCKTSWSKLRKGVPSLTFHFRGADMHLPADNYLMDLEKLVCLAFARSDSVSIFGNIQQQNFHIMYDLEAHLLSFTPAACDTL